MNAADFRTNRPAANAASLILLTGAVAVVMGVALLSPLKDDIAWLLYCARRWLAGRELYVDVIEVNPPLIIWLSAVPILLGRWLDISAQFTALPLFGGIVLVCGWWTACVLRPLGGIFQNRVPVFALLGIVLLLIPAADLGQREHLLVAAFLPYLALLARDLAGGPLARGLGPGSAAAAAGVLAALGCALKPQYGLVFMALEGVALCHGLKPWRAAPLAAALALAAYLGAVAWICPAYLHHAVPMALALYGATDVSFWALLRENAPVLLAEAFVLHVWWRDRRTPVFGPLLLTALVFAAVSTAICFLDGKDWFYHRLPAAVMSVLAIALWLSTGRPASHRPAAYRRNLVFACAALALFGVSAIQRLEPEVKQAVEPKLTTVARLEQVIRQHHARTYIAFSEWIALGFPVVNNTGVAWASRFDSMWALKGEIWRAGFDKTAAREWPVAHWVVHDFMTACPDIAVVDTREHLNYIAVLSASEPAFARVWTRYKPIVAFDGLTVYKRGKGGCIDPWIAAQGPGRGTAIQ